MKNQITVLLLLSIIALTQDPYCLRTNQINNCLQCIPFFFLKNGICTQVSTTCLTYNNVTGTCQTCLPNFLLRNGNCENNSTGTSVPSQPFGSTLGGNIFNAAPGTGGSISQTPVLTVLSSNSPIVSGLTSSSLTYSTSSLPSVQNYRDPNCIQFVLGSNRCSRCALRFYISNQTGLCTAISGECSSYDQNTGACQGSFQGFLFMNGECYIQVNGGVSAGDPNCRTYLGNSCSSCYQGYYIANNGTCITSNTLCATITPNGNCLSCYSGYQLYQGNCIITQISGSSPNCASYVNGICVRCSQSSYFLNGNCIPVSPLCRTYDNYTGNCLSCYNGYYLQGSNCILSPSSGIAQNCKNFTNGMCVECSQGYLMIGGTCRQSDPQCQTVNPNTGFCTSCYGGYSLNGYGQCILQTGNLPPINCRIWQNGRCYQCSNRFYMTSNGQCIPVNDYCNDYDNLTGSCLTCYQGFILTQGVCYKVLVTSSAQSQQVSYPQSTQSSFPLLQSVNSQPYQTQASNGIQNAGGGDYYQQTTTTTLTTSNQNLPSGTQGTSYPQQGGFILSSSNLNNNSPFSPTVMGSALFSGSQPCLQQSSSGSCLSCIQSYKLIDGRCILIVQ